MTSVCYKCGMWLKKHVPFLSFNRALVGGADRVPDETDLPPSPRGLEARHEVQRRAAQALQLRASSPNVSPRNAELSYYERERQYNGRSDSDRSEGTGFATEEFKDERDWPSKGGKYGMLENEDPKPSDVYEEIQRKHRERQHKKASWPLSALFGRILLGQQDERRGFYKPTITEQHIDETSMVIYTRGQAFHLLRNENLSGVEATYIKRLSVATPNRLIGYQICLLYPEDVSDMEWEGDSPYCHGNGVGFVGFDYDGRAGGCRPHRECGSPSLNTLEDSDLVHGNNAHGDTAAKATKAIVPPLPSIELGPSGYHAKRHRRDPRALARAFEALSCKEAIDEDVASFEERIRLVVDARKVKDPISGKNRTHFVLVGPDGGVEVVPLRRSAEKTHGYHFTVLRLIKTGETPSDCAHIQDIK